MPIVVRVLTGEPGAFIQAAKALRPKMMHLFRPSDLDRRP
jgi:hypothetical protein